MAYIGNIPAESYASFETETFSVSATANYTLSHAVTNENEIRLVINGVVQQPGSGKAYTASGTTLTLTSATVSGDSMYAVYLGRALQTVNPPNASVGLSQLSATGTKSSSTFLRGDNTFASAGGTNTPSFMVLLASGQSISGSTNTVVAFDTEIFDTDNAVSSGVFTVPSGKAGKYFFAVNGGINTGNNVDYVNIWLSKNSQTTIASTNGEAIGIEYYHAGSTGTANQARCVSGTMNLAVGDTVRVYIAHNFGSAKNTTTGGRFTFSGHKLI